MDIHWFTETVPGAIVTFLGGVTTIGTTAAGAAKAWRWVIDKKVQSVPESPPAAHANPFAHPPPTDPALLALAQTSHQASQVIMQQARFSLDELRKALENAGRDQAQMAQQMAIKERLVERLQLELEAERQKRATALAVVEDRDARIAALEAERADLEARIPTPLRPPRPRSV